MNYIAPNDLETHLIAFRELTSWEEKISYWQDDLKEDYILFLYEYKDRVNYHPFKIVLSEEEVLSFSKWLIQNYPTSQAKYGWDFTLLDLEGMKKGFDIILHETNEKSLIIRNELKSIDESFEEVRSPFNRGELTIINFKYRADYQTYKDFLGYGLPPQFLNSYQWNEIIFKENGRRLAEYRQYVSSLLEKVKTSQVTETSKAILSAAQLALLLDYTSVLEGMKKTDSTIIARLFSSITMRGYKGVYIGILDVVNNKPRNTSDLQAVKNYLQDNEIRLNPTSSRRLEKDLKASLDKD